MYILSDGMWYIIFMVLYVMGSYFTCMYIDLMLTLCFFIMNVCLQESVKSRHPQLLYEAKIYRILQGGSKKFPMK